MRRRVVSIAGPLAVLALLLLAPSCGGSDAPGSGAAGDGLEGLPEERIRPEELFGEAKDPGMVVARVGEVEITAGKVYEVAALNMAEMLAAGRALDEAQERGLREAVLGMIIDDELLTQRAEELGVEVSDQEVDAQYLAAQERSGTVEAFEQRLAEEGLSADEYRAEIRRRLRKQVFIDELTADVTVTEEEAKTFYDANPERFSEGEKAEVRQILIKSTERDPKARREDAEARIAEAHARAVAGDDFADLAREYSEAPNAADGGLVSDEYNRGTGFPRGAMVPKFEEQAFSLPPGSISDVFQIPQGLTFLKVEKHFEPTVIPYAEVKPTLMLELAQAKKALIVQAELQSLRADGDVELLEVDFLDPKPVEAGEEGGA